MTIPKVRSWLTCISCGYQTSLLTERLFECPRCKDLFEVEHDFSLFRPTMASSWRKLFDSRIRPKHSSGPKYNSGVWRFGELVFPEAEDKDIVTLGEGVYPMWPAGKNLRQWIGGNIDLWIIPEGLNPTGSFKDNGGTVALTAAYMAGVKRTACASTGDTSAMASAYGGAVGIQNIVILPKDYITPAQLAQPLVHGSTVILIPASFDLCMEYVQEIARQGLAFIVNSKNPIRIEGHQSTVFQTAQFLDWKLPDVFVVPVGNGSNTSSIGKGIRTLKQTHLIPNDSRCRIIGAQSRAANPLAMAYENCRKSIGNSKMTEQDLREFYEPLLKLGDTSATAARIGKPVSWKKVIRSICENDGEIRTVEEADLNEAVMVAGRDGHFVCPQTGMVLASLRQAVREKTVHDGQIVFVVSTATGLKFTDVPAKMGESLIKVAKTTDFDEVIELAGI